MLLSPTLVWKWLPQLVVKPKIPDAISPRQSDESSIESSSSTFWDLWPSAASSRQITPIFSELTRPALRDHHGSSELPTQGSPFCPTSSTQQSSHQLFRQPMPSYIQAVDISMGWLRPDKPRDSCSNAPKRMPESLESGRETELTCNSGVPIYCVLITASISVLTYMTVSVAGSTVFLWVRTLSILCEMELTRQFANLTTVAGLLTWISICYAFTRFHKAQQLQGLADENPWFRSPFQPYLAWSSLTFFAVLLIFNGFPVFMSGKWNVSDFLVSYIGLPYVQIVPLKRLQMLTLEEFSSPCSLSGRL